MIFPVVTRLLPSDAYFPPLLEFSPTTRAKAKKTIFLIMILIINRLNKRFRTLRVADASVVGGKTPTTAWANFC